MCEHIDINITLSFSKKKVIERVKEITFVSAVSNSSSTGNLGERPEHNA